MNFAVRHFNFSCPKFSFQSQCLSNCKTMYSNNLQIKNTDSLKESVLKSEKEGFEPSRQITPPNTLAGCRLQPLGHFSFWRIFSLAKKSMLGKRREKLLRHLKTRINLLKYKCVVVKVYHESKKFGTGCPC